MTTARKVAIALAVILLLPLALAALVEGTYALIRHVAFLQRSGPLLQTARLLYLEHRNTIQYMPECARYDPQTSYVLKPGVCEFSNDEFRTTVRVNHLGLRDDEMSLVRPEIVVLGDSYAMGWGVEQDETFASLLESSTGLRVLNAAISSYGTVRELKLLSRIDTAAMRYLIIQYAGNDYEENRTYLHNGKRLDIMSEESYVGLVHRHEAERSYYPGKYVATQLKAWRLGMHVGAPGALRADDAPVPKLPQPRLRSPVTAESLEEAGALLDVLEASPVDLHGVQLVVLAIACPGDFLEALHQQIEAKPRPGFIEHMKMSQLEAILSAADYFRLDDHLRPRGHAAIAQHVRALLDL